MERILEGFELAMLCPREGIPDFALVSNRLRFQWAAVKAIGPGARILNVGCADDPLGFGNLVHHCDIDDWSKLYKERGQTFIQADAHELTSTFAPDSYDLVVLGDILEHCPLPGRVIRQALIVAKYAVCLTVWEEWRLGREGYSPCASNDLFEAETGCEVDDVRDWYEEAHYGVVCTQGVAIPHLFHIWQFTDEIVEGIVARMPIQPLAYIKAPETVHEGHQVFNWLLLFVKAGTPAVVSCCDTQYPYIFRNGENTFQCPQCGRLLVVNKC